MRPVSLVRTNVIRAGFHRATLRTAGRSHFGLPGRDHGARHGVRRRAIHVFWGLGPAKTLMARLRAPGRQGTRTAAWPAACCGIGVYAPRSTVLFRSKGNPNEVGDVRIGGGRRPDHIFVAYFAISPEHVRLDRGVTARFARSADDPPLDIQTSQAIRPLQVSLAEGLVGRLKAYGLPAEIATNNTGSGSGLLVQGQIVSIERGKARKRALIGLGGVGGIDGDTQLYDLTETAQPRFLMAFEGQALSGGRPDAERLTDMIARRIGAFAVAQGWIRQTAVK